METIGVSRIWVYNQSMDMHRFRPIFFSLVFLIPAAGAQQDPVAVQDGGEPIRVVVDEVTVPFIVTDKDNRLITDLKREDFEVLEENVPQEITGFSQETNLPLRIGLLVDTSNSIRDRLDFEKRAAADFLRTLIRPGSDKALLGSFDSMAELHQDFTDDLDKLIGAIELLRAGGGTALYDAVLYAARDRLQVEAPPNSEFRRALVVLGDGEDNQSRFSRAQTMEVARRAEVLIYTISTNIRGIRTPGDKVLQEFARETGGRFFQPYGWDDLDDAFQEIGTELRSQYTLGYRPSMPRDGEYHTIDIRVKNKDRKGLQVRARRGYFATYPSTTPPTGVASE